MAPQPLYSKLESGDHDSEASQLQGVDDGPEPRRSRRWYLAGGISLVALMVAVFAVVKSSVLLSHTEQPFPQIPWTTRKFFPQDQYMGDGEESNRLWEAMMPMGQGYINVHDPDRYGLEPGLPSDEESTQIYGLSVFHQLHCLGVLRGAFNDLSAGRPVKAQGMHPDHCFDYLRQTLMCHADTTIEHPQLVEQGEGENKTTKAFVNGYYIEHKCRDWKTLIDATEDHRAGNWTGLVDA